VWCYVCAGSWEHGLNVNTKEKAYKAHLKCREAASSHDVNKLWQSLSQNAVHSSSVHESRDDWTI